MTNIRQDVRYGLRVLRKNPGFTAVAVLTLALGIGANSALFSVVNGVLLNPLPFPNPNQLVAVYSRTGTFQENHSFSFLGAFRSDDFNMTGVGEPERLHAHMISAEFFPALGLKPVLGRNFRPEEDIAGAGPLAILSDGIWKRKFGSSPEVLGRSVTLNGKVYTVIGVARGRIPGLSLATSMCPLVNGTILRFATAASAWA